MQFLSVGFFIQKILLAPLEVPWDDFIFCRRFTEILNKKSAQQCMIHRRMVTGGCILHQGMATWCCILHCIVTTGSDALPVITELHSSKK